MKNNTVLGMLALVTIMVSCSCVNPAVAYNSELSGGGIVLAYIHYHIDDGGDVAEFSEITANDSRQEQYKKNSTTEQGYPAATVTVHDSSNTDQSIIDSSKDNSHFDLDLGIPAGIYYCLKVDAYGRFATNDIYVSSPNYPTIDGNPYYIKPSSSLWGNSVVKYFGTNASNQLIMADEISDSLWIYSDTNPTTLHIEGDRDRNGLGNSGHLIVTIVMKPQA